jgi:phytoene dehydrogenase-like protein
MKYGAIVVGGGIAGLTAAAYLAKEGISTALFEKEKETGGLVNSFDYKGFVLDGGIRAIEDLGITMPMLKQLGIDIDFVPNPVSIGVEDIMVRLKDETSLEDYRGMLVSLYPESEEDIDRIIAEVKKIMGYMDIQYGIENPVFKDIKNDKEYLMHELMPWMVKYISTIGKVKKISMPVDEYLRRLTDNKELIDIIAQHFFTKTPAYFALSYFTLYLNYQYPKGGTGKLTRALEQFVLENGGEIKTQTEIMSVDLDKKQIVDTKGQTYDYKSLIWAADMSYLYSNARGKATDTAKVQKHKKMLEGAQGGDSVFTLYALTDLDREYFAQKHGAHVFYTPDKSGLGKVDAGKLKAANGEFTENKEDIINWLREYFKYNTYEIAIPAMRDPSLAPEGKTALIISTLMDYYLFEHIKDMGWYDEIKAWMADEIIRVLNESIYDKIAEHTYEKFSSSPLTIKERTGNLHGAITGWAFTNSEMPAVHNLPSIAQSVKTYLPDVFQAGQWTFSPSGLPISIVTGKMAADRALKKLK